MSRIYIGRLSCHAREKDVERFFKGFGRIKDINLKNGFGFVEFDDPRDADDAVYELNGRELQGERVIVEHARGSSSGYGGRHNDRGGGDRGGGYSSSRVPVWLGKYGPPTRTDYRIIVENISSRVSWQDLKDFMRQAGEITFADAHKQRVGEGVVEYASYDDMRSAMRKLDGADLNGRRLKLTEDYRGSKRRSRSRSRSRNRRSRSRSTDRRRRSRSRSHSRDRRSRSRDRSRSPRRSRSRSKERNRSRSRSKEARGRSHSKSRSRSRSRSKSASPARNRSHERSHSKSRSRSHSKEHSPVRNGSPPRSRSASRERSASPKKSPAPEAEMRSRSNSPVAEQQETD